VIDWLRRFGPTDPPPISDVLMLALAWPAQSGANRRFQKSARGPARKKGRPRLPSVAKQHSRGLGHHAPHGRSVIRLWRAGCVPSEVRRPIRSRDLVQVESSAIHVSRRKPQGGLMGIMSHGSRPHQVRKLGSSFTFP